MVRDAEVGEQAADAPLDLVPDRADVLDALSAATAEALRSSSAMSSSIW